MTTLVPYARNPVTHVKQCPKKAHASVRVVDSLRYEAECGRLSGLDAARPSHIQRHQPYNKGEEWTTVRNDAWRKSTFSGVADCVEVATSDNEVRVRDSKDPRGAVLDFTVAEWQAFVAGAKAGEFDV
jgi:hypothetical protein